MTVITNVRKKKPGRRSVQDEGMAALEAAADTKDEGAFWLIFNDMKWEKRPSEDFTKAVELALMAGAYQTARRLAKEGHQRFPDNARLKTMSYVLAPPEAHIVESQNRSSWKANRQWLHTNRHRYKGRWVALRNGELLAVAQSPTELTTQIGEIKGKGILLTLL